MNPTRLRALGCAALGLALAGVAAGQDVINEGTGTRRAALDAMIHQPAPTTEILGVEEWIGDAPTLGDISGRPVLVFTWAEWYRPSHSVAMLANRLAGEFDDLVVIGVHDAEGWDEAATFAERRRLSFPIAHDADGSIRKLLNIDQDPDVFVFDRAGQVRYADITTESMRTAIEEVIGEDTESAANVQSRLAQQRAEAARERRRARGINEGVGFDSTLNVPFVKPSPEEYAAVKWPERSSSDDDRRRSRREDSGPTSWSVPTERWLRDRAPNAEGRVRVVYTWHPADRDSLDRLMYRMDDVQKKYGRDVVVIGAMPPVIDDSRRRRDEDPDPLRNLPVTTDTIQAYVGNRTLSHYLLAASNGINIPVENERRRRGDVTPTGSVMIVSTDGIVRRAEHSSNWEELQRALDTTLRVDPGVKARRAAEDEFIRAGGG
jgi:peroxiredoxin